MENSTSDLIDRYIKMFGTDTLEEELLRQIETEERGENVLTIVANEGVHPLPENFIMGEIFTVTHGNLDYSSPEIIKSQFRDALSLLSVKLRSQNWNRVFLMPFGPSVLSMQIKLLVYRINGIETVDLFHVARANIFIFNCR